MIVPGSYTNFGTPTVLIPYHIMFGIFDDLFGDDSYYPYQYCGYPTRPRTAYRPQPTFNPFEDEQPREMDNDAYEQLYKAQEERYKRQKEEIER